MNSLRNPMITKVREGKSILAATPSGYLLIPWKATKVRAERETRLRKGCGSVFPEWGEKWNTKSGLVVFKFWPARVDEPTRASVRRKVSSVGDVAKPKHDEVGGRQGRET